MRGGHGQISGESRVMFVKERQGQEKRKRGSKADNWREIMDRVKVNNKRRHGREQHKGG